MDLTPEQVRVLGALVEKEATTPDQYPLSTNGLVMACNQKNNRDPLVSYTEREVDQVMLDLRQAGLARTVHAAGARVPKHRHVLDDAWGLTREQLAVLAVLMLRGPNTVNELHTRTERYVHLPDADAVRAVVRSLEERDPPMAVELGRQVGQRETRFTHLLLGGPANATAAPPPPVAPAERHGDLAPVPAPDAGPAPTPALATPASSDELARLRADLDDLRARFDELSRRLGEDV